MNDKTSVLPVALPPWQQNRVEQLVHAAFALGSEYERAMTTAETIEVGKKLHAAIEEARAFEELEYPVVVLLPRRVYEYLAETYPADADVGTTIREMCVSAMDADRDTIACESLP